MNNVDFAETQKFEALAFEWWNKNGKCRPLHDLNPTRLQFIVDRMDTLEGKTVIDVGCGAGILSESLAKRGAIVTGIEVVPSLIQVAELHARSQGLSDRIAEVNPTEHGQHFTKRLNYAVSTAENYAREHPHAFDMVTCMELLEHVPDPLSLLTACATLVKPGGQLFFSTLNRNPKSLLFAIIAAEYILQLLPRGTHQYSKFIRPAELAAALRKADLNLLEVAGLEYNPLTHRASITNNVSVNYLAHAVRLE